MAKFPYFARLQRVSTNSQKLKSRTYKPYFPVVQISRPVYAPFIINNDFCFVLLI